ncbi:hypothetical protein G8C93_00755 [Cellulosimicrobium cellulans]|uniref:hypothetical protein n=1 Tax=Cellulosimicrobium cellulans TaxID=1710 RepID=UPI00188378E2|nr:hypothetical protein [Cellulosimicrobium cellulans]MBE9924421.1 hypothetical protein [Cellulosimicrobium cellulans]
MTDTPPDPPLLIEPAPSRSPDAAIRALGFDPALIQSLVITPTSAVAVAADYPDPHVEV